MKMEINHMKPHSKTPYDMVQRSGSSIKQKHI